MSMILALLLVGALPDPLAAGWEGEPVCEKLEENETVRVLRCTFPPGVGHDQHRHAPHWGYILQGGVQQITDASGTRTITTKAGAQWWSDGTEHTVLNVGDTTTQYLIVEPKEADK
ncbi:hypothetical protein [Parvularcula sp. LCG005]|uniref:hypothetical protein n=1 Tax=Parvularcula sp. LCG005 TaxID=3078805 RepID=UPI00294268B2|nr:hypothetical protein [Parvularcula sp. LCG005]WOI54615.1 hypothetical protein RUI03_06350 [Parvularcula sp. LCG005]